MIDLNALNTLFDKSTQGEWKSLEANYAGWLSVNAASEYDAEQSHDANTALIVALHNAWPEIAKELEWHRYLAEMQKKRMTRAVAWWRNLTGKDNNHPDLGDLLKLLVAHAEAGRKLAEAVQYARVEKVEITKTKFGEGRYSDFGYEYSEVEAALREYEDSLK